MPGLHLLRIIMNNANRNTFKDSKDEQGVDEVSDLNSSDLASEEEEEHQSESDHFDNEEDME